MVEFFESFEIRDIGVFTAPLLLLFFSSWGIIGALILRRKRAKREEFPHTMSNEQYIAHNEKRFNGAGGTSAGYSSDCTGPR
jgi:hypothetical protein